MIPPLPQLFVRTVRSVIEIQCEAEGESSNHYFELNDFGRQKFDQ